LILSQQKATINCERAANPLLRQMNNRIVRLPRIVPHAWSSAGCLWCGELDEAERGKPCPKRSCKTWYEVLGLPLYANEDQIKTAYLRLAEEWNPKRLKTRHDIAYDGGFSQTQTMWFSAAYAALMNPIERERHDVEILSALTPQGESVN